jgi:hypothetical protein
MYFVSETAQIELKSGRVSAPTAQVCVAAQPVRVSQLLQGVAATRAFP